MNNHSSLHKKPGSFRMVLKLKDYEDSFLTIGENSLPIP